MTPTPRVSDELAARRAFREFVRTHHPDRGGDPAVYVAGLAALRRRRTPAGRGGGEVVYYRRRRGLAVVTGSWRDGRARRGLSIALAGFSGFLVTVVAALIAFLVGRVLEGTSTSAPTSAAPPAAARERRHRPGPGGR